jgi:hypothetical protein
MVVDEVKMLQQVLLVLLEILMLQLHLCMVKLTPANGGDPTNGLYGAGRFAYSINQFSSSCVTVATASWADVEYSTELSASIAAGELYCSNSYYSLLTRQILKVFVHLY